MATVPRTVVVAHLALLAAIVRMAHHKVVSVGLLLLFLGIANAHEQEIVEVL